MRYTEEQIRAAIAHAEELSRMMIDRAERASGVVARKLRRIADGHAKDANVWRKELDKLTART